MYIIFFYRTNLALWKYNFTFNFCRVVIEKVGFKVRLRYGTHMVRKQVRCNYSKVFVQILILSYYINETHGTYGLLVEFHMGKKNWTMVGFDLISRGN